MTSPRIQRRSLLYSSDPGHNLHGVTSDNRRKTFSYGSASETDVAKSTSKPRETDQRPESTFLMADNRLTNISIQSKDDQDELDNMADIQASDSDTRLPSTPDNQEVPFQSQPMATPPLRRIPSYYTPYMEDRLKRRLKFFFMGPHEKLKARRRCPWKLILQVLKIFAVTIQLIQFGYERTSFVEYVQSNTIAMKHLYLRDWNAGYETMPYPPAAGVYALYEIPELYAHINFVMKQFNETENMAVGSYRFMRDNGTVQQIQMCNSHYEKGDIYLNDTWEFDATVVRGCYDIGPVLKFNETTHKEEYVYDIEALLNSTNRSIHFDRLLNIDLHFKLKSFRLDIDDRHSSPECFKVEGEITFNNKKHDGQMTVDLQATLMELSCKGKFSKQNAEKNKTLMWSMYDCFIIFVSVLSGSLCFRSIVRAQKLAKETQGFFKNRFGKALSWSDRFEFLNLWYVVILINDTMTVVGSAFKLQLENRNTKSSSENYDICAVMLGTGSLLAWLGVLRYIGFFHTFNILIITLKRAFPNVLRFLVCGMMLYFGFMFAGWLVLGPYHIKFRDLSTASECLFSLINGDDMFVTFSATMTKNSLVWYYSRIYLYVFISLFIYVVLSLFIAVIMDTYETLKHGIHHGEAKSELFQFIDECSDSHNSPLFRGEGGWHPLTFLCFCCNKNDPDHPGEYTSLLNPLS
ncbi:hypothetical protein ScPMuIL_006913 [Solemya velum]